MITFIWISGQPKCMEEPMRIKKHLERNLSNHSVGHIIHLIERKFEASFLSAFFFSICSQSIRGHIARGKEETRTRGKIYHVFFVYFFSLFRIFCISLFPLQFSLSPLFSSAISLFSSFTNSLQIRGSLYRYFDSLFCNMLLILAVQ